MGRIKSVNISEQKGEGKRPVGGASLRQDWGLEGDVHSGHAKRQVSLLSWEAVTKQNELLRERNEDCPKTPPASPHSPDRADGELRPGDYAENLTTEDIDLAGLRVGDRLAVGNDVVLEVSQLGKECHRHCAIYDRLGDCVMPREGIFATVIEGGSVADGDEVRLVAHSDSDPE